MQFLESVYNFIDIVIDSLVEFGNKINNIDQYKYERDHYGMYDYIPTDEMWDDPKTFPI